MEPLGEWCRANNEAYQGIFIDEHHLGAGNEENESKASAERPQLEDRDWIGTKNGL